MRPFPLLATLALSTTSTHAVAETTVSNSCPFSIYYAPTDSQAPTSMHEIPPSNTVSQDQWFDGITGTALKITRDPDGLWTSKPVLNFGYTVKNGETWYDISMVNGYDFWGERIVLRGDVEGVEEIVWDGEPGPVHVAHWVGEVNLTLEVCAGG